MSTNVHESMVDEMLARGYVEVYRYTRTNPKTGEDFTRVTLVDPETTCAFRMPMGDLCCLDKGHKGARHASHWNVYYCDACGKARRGRPYRSDEDVAICFMCQEITNPEPWAQKARRQRERTNSA